MHLKDAIGRLNRGQTVQGRAAPGTVSGSSNRVTTGAFNHYIQCTASSFSFFYWKIDVKFSCFSVTFEKPPDMSDVDRATYVDAINFFCDMQQDKALERIRNSASYLFTEDNKRKNTVLVLPKIPGKTHLIRLGETHESRCPGHRNTLYTSG